MLSPFASPMRCEQIFPHSAAPGLIESVMTTAPAVTGPIVAPAARGSSIVFLLRLEGLLVAAVTAVLYARTGASWWLFAALWLAPDLSMLGYLAEPCRGARVYNAFHTYVGAGCAGPLCAALARARRFAGCAHLGQPHRRRPLARLTDSSTPTGLATRTWGAWENGEPITRCRSLRPCAAKAPARSAIHRNDEDRSGPVQMEVAPRDAENRRGRQVAIHVSSGRSPRAKPENSRKSPPA